mgnify:CR=1 FL=1
MIGLVCAIPLISALFSGCAAPPPFATGYVEGEYVLIAPLASAQLLDLPVARGDRVAAGQTVAVMESRESAAKRPFSWQDLGLMFKSRKLIGIYFGQFTISATFWFFLTWFPVYLVQERGMTILKAGFIASLPAICGFIGGVLGGVISDYLLRKGHSLTFARKAPIIAGLLVSSSIVACNYVDIEWMVVGFMALAFFGKGVGAGSWRDERQALRAAAIDGRRHDLLADFARLEEAAVAEDLIDLHGLLLKQDVQPGAHRAQRGIKLDAHEVGEIEVAVRRAHEHRAPLFEVRHVLTGQIAVSEQAAGVRVARQRQVE